MLTFNHLFLEYGGAPPPPPQQQGYPQQQEKPGLLDKIKSSWEVTKSIAPIAALTVGGIMSMASIPAGKYVSGAGVIGLLPQRFKMMGMQAQNAWQKSMMNQGYNQPPRMR